MWWTRTFTTSAWRYHRYVGPNSCDLDIYCFSPFDCIRWQFCGMESIFVIRVAKLSKIDQSVWQRSKIFVISQMSIHYYSIYICLTIQYHCGYFPWVRLPGEFHPENVYLVGFLRSRKVIFMCHNTLYLNRYLAYQCQRISKLFFCCCFSWEVLVWWWFCFMCIACFTFSPVSIPYKKQVVKNSYKCLYRTFFSICAKIQPKKAIRMGERKNIIKYPLPCRS